MTGWFVGVKLERLRKYAAAVWLEYCLISGVEELRKATKTSNTMAGVRPSFERGKKETWSCNEACSAFMLTDGLKHTFYAVFGGSLGLKWWSYPQRTLTFTVQCCFTITRLQYLSDRMLCIHENGGRCVVFSWHTWMNMHVYWKYVLQGLL